MMNTFFYAKLIKKIICLFYPTTAIIDKIRMVFFFDQIRTYLKGKSRMMSLEKDKHRSTNSIKSILNY